MFSKLCKITVYSDVNVRGDLDTLRDDCGLLSRAESLSKRLLFHNLWARMRREKIIGLAILTSVIEHYGYSNGFRRLPPSFLVPFERRLDRFGEQLVWLRHELLWQHPSRFDELYLANRCRLESLPERLEGCVRDNSKYRRLYCKKEVHETYLRLATAIV